MLSRIIRYLAGLARSFGCLHSLRSSWRVLLCGSFLLLLLHGLVTFEQIREHGGFADIDIPLDRTFIPLGIDHMENFSWDTDYKIPKIIHQTWKNDKIPKRFHKWIKSWKQNHPGWEYWLWTDSSARQLLEDKFFEFLPIFDNYSENIRRADALRYFVLYEFGGVYADMDVESLKPIDPMARKYSCFLAQEPYEHPILDSNFEHLVINALMGCRKGHPFMKRVIDLLPYHSHMWNVLDSTGPHFLTSAFRQYNDQTGHPDSLDYNGTYLAPAEYFFPTIDPVKHFWMRQQCSRYEKLTAIQQRACMQLKVVRSRGNPMDLAFTDHHWVHTYLNFRFTLKAPSDIHSIIPDVVIYKVSGHSHIYKDTDLSNIDKDTD